MFPPNHESCCVKVLCGRTDYSASRLARAVEDCDAHLLNLNILATSPSADMVVVLLRVGKRCSQLAQHDTAALAPTDTLFSIEGTYKGKMLTPIHFAMTPKQRPAGNRRYTIKWKPLRSGGKKPLVTSGEPGFLAPSGYSSGTPAIPFQRAGKMRKPIHAVKRLSVPIMIENEKVAPKIEREIMQRMEKGMSRYCK